MLNSQQLSMLSQVDIADIDKNKLVDISSVSIDTSLPGIKRMENYLEQVINPYCYRCGNTVVHLRFESNVELSDRLKNYFISLKKASM